MTKHNMDRLMAVAPMTPWNLFVPAIDFELALVGCPLDVFRRAGLLVSKCDEDEWITESIRSCALSILQRSKDREDLPKNEMTSFYERMHRAVEDNHPVALLLWTTRSFGDSEFVNGFGFHPKRLLMRRKDFEPVRQRRMLRVVVALFVAVGCILNGKPTTLDAADTCFRGASGNFVKMMMRTEFEPKTIEPYMVTTSGGERLHLAKYMTERVMGMRKGNVESVEIGDGLVKINECRALIAVDFFVELYLLDGNGPSVPMMGDAVTVFRRLQPTKSAYGNLLWFTFPRQPATFVDGVKYL